jgi:hypothetical protein
MFMLCSISEAVKVRREQTKNAVLTLVSDHIDIAID